MELAMARDMMERTRATTMLAIASSGVVCFSTMLCIYQSMG